MPSLPPRNNHPKTVFQDPRTLFAIILCLTVLAAVLVPHTTSVQAGAPTNAIVSRPPANLPAPTILISQSIVISQVYGGGGNTGATFKNDFIELLNRGSSAVDLNGWAVQYASSAGTNWQVTALTNVTLQPGQYYLVQEATGTGGTTGLPTPDATGTIAMSLSAGKVALTSSTASLSGSGCPLGAGGLVDFVGYGSAANCSEGSGPTATLTNTTAALRANSGCTETDSSSADFATGSPNPRNTDDPVHTCGGPSNPSAVGAANPNSLPPASPTLLTVTVTPGTSPASTGITVTGDLSPIGGSATQQFFDNATNGDVNAGDNIFTYQATVGGGTTGGVKTLPIAVSDAEARMGSTNISLTVQAPANPSVTGAANPSAVAQGGSVVLTATVAPGLVPGSTGLAVSGDLSSIGGSATQQFFDDGSNGDTVANNNVYTFQTLVPAATTTGAKSLSLTVTDAQTRSGSGSISLTVVMPAGPHDPAEHMVMGNPSGATADAALPNNYLMMKLQYALSYNNARRIPNWTSWHLDDSWRGSAARQDDYRNDTSLPPGFNQVQSTDYGSSGFDRGHMCPSADRTSSIPDNSATFLMTNMVPQAPGNNQGPWALLENYLRAFLPGSEIYIVSGGTGIGGTGSGGGVTNTTSGGVTVPATTWKVALILQVGDNDVSRVDANARTIAVIMPNLDSIRSDQWQKYLATVDQVEALSGYDFFSNVPAATQSAFEAKPDAVNDTAPVTAGQTKTTTADHSVAVTLTATDFNVNSAFTYTIVTPPGHGLLSGSGANRTYSPELHYIGPDSFTFKANDGALDSNISTVSVTVASPTASMARISGLIVTASGQPVSGTTITVSGGARVMRAITDSEGRYQVTNAETGRFYTVTPSRANYTFAPAERSFSLVEDKTDAVFTGTMSGDAVNPLDTAEYFVRQQYLDVLGREPDEAGFNYWSEQINQCLSEPPAVVGGLTPIDCVRSRRISVASAFFIEQEFRQSGAFIYNVYRSALGRRLGYSEYSADRKQVVGGPTLEQQKQAFVAAFVARAEFATRYQSSPTAASFVDALLANVQASGIDLSSQRESLIGRYNAGSSQNESRTLVIREVTESGAVRDGNYNAAFVLVEYFGYLHRNPDPNGYDFWLNVLNTGDPGNYRGMVCSFITSAEYQRRFSTVVSHSNAECAQ